MPFAKLSLIKRRNEMTKFADDGSEKVARERLEQDRAVLKHAREQFAERTKGKPTPTQEENDLAALGAHILEHDDDGSGPDPFNALPTRHMEGKPGGGYETRAARPATSPSKPVP
jgi:hypothetical protein